MAKTYDFGDALYFLRQGRTVAREGWDDDKELELDDAGRLIFTSDNGTEVYDPTHDDVLSEDWYDL